MCTTRVLITEHILQKRLLLFTFNRGQSFTLGNAIAPRVKERPNALDTDGVLFLFHGKISWQQDAPLSLVRFDRCAICEQGCGFSRRMDGAEYI